MAEKQKRIESLEKGKEILHAVKTIGNKHLIAQISNLQDGLRTSPMADHSNAWIKDIEQFRAGVELSGSKINKNLKQAILEYCELAVEYHKSYGNSD